MEMDSHEERLHTMIQDSKREAAKEEAGRRAKELREKAKEAVSPATASIVHQCSIIKVVAMAEALVILVAAATPVQYQQRAVVESATHSCIVTVVVSPDGPDVRLLWCLLLIRCFVLHVLYP